MEMPSLFFTFGLTVLTTVATLGAAWGVYKTKLSSLFKYNSELASAHSSLTAKLEKIKELISEEDNKITLSIEVLDKEINKKVDTALRDLEKNMWTMENKFASKTIYIDSIPIITEELHKLKIEVVALPSKLSSELTKTFSDEYQKIISVIVNKR